MKVECATMDLKEAATLAQRFTNKQAQLEALQGVLLIAEGKTLTLRATNLEFGVEVSIPAKIVDTGVCAVSGATLASLTNNLPLSVKTTTLAVEGSLLTLTTDKSVSHIKTLAHEDFPILPTVSAENTFTIDAGEFAKLLRSVAFCAAISSIKPELQSVLVYSEDGKLTAAATDSFRLAERSISYKGTEVPHILIPVRNAAELIRILESGKGSVDVYFSENQLSIRLDDIYFTTRLIDGSFPNYRGLLPGSFETEALVLKEDLSQALKTIAVFADKYAQVTLSVAPKKKEVAFSSRNTDVGEHTIAIPATCSGQSVEMNFNGKYIADALQSVTGESLRLGLNGPGKPLAMLSGSEKGFIYIVMPMNR
jgi:DNA polymerase III subunit beta